MSRANNNRKSDENMTSNTKSRLIRIKTQVTAKSVICITWLLRNDNKQKVREFESHCDNLCGIQLWCSAQERGKCWIISQELLNKKTVSRCGKRCFYQQLLRVFLFINQKMHQKCGVRRNFFLFIAATFGKFWESLFRNNLIFFNYRKWKAIARHVCYYSAILR